MRGYPRVYFTLVSMVRDSKLQVNRSNLYGPWIPESWYPFGLQAALPLSRSATMSWVPPPILKQSSSWSVWFLTRSHNGINDNTCPRMMGVQGLPSFRVVSLLKDECGILHEQRTLLLTTTPCRVPPIRSSTSPTWMSVIVRIIYSELLRLSTFCFSCSP